MQRMICSILLVLAVFLMPATALAGTVRAVQPTDSSQVAAQPAASVQTNVGEFRGSRGFGTRSRFRSYGRSYSYPRYGGSGYGFGSHLFSFGAGWFLGSMFHPFGGYYGWGSPYGYHPFSLLGLIGDLIVLWIIWRIIRFFFRR